MARRRRYSRMPRRGRVIGAAFAVLAAVAVVLTSCRTSTSPRFERPPLAAVPRSEPTVRVRIAAGVDRVLIEGPGHVQVGVFLGPGQVDQARTFSTPLHILRRDNRFELHPAGGQPLAWRVDALLVTPLSGADGMSVNGTSYPGRLALHAADLPQRPGTGLDVVNHVLMETYLPGVLERELYSYWHSQTFIAQAIAARSYAIATMARTRNRHYDLESTTASQVYGGVARNTRAIDAVRQTRGVVLMWADQVLPAYYSSSCGGSGQDAAYAFPNAQSIPPLAATYRGNWCSNSNSFRWGPIAHDRTQLSQRIAAWGKAGGMSIANLKKIRQITIASRNGVGRPVSFQIVDEAGKAYTLGAEHFRFACNYDGPGAPPLPSGSTLKSSHVTPVVQGERVVFTDGRGHGHGVGLCQHGAQAMAQQGHHAVSILNFYYPQAELKRIY